MSNRKYHKCSSSQKEVLKILSHTGVISSSNLKKLDIKMSSINALINSGHIQKKNVLHHKNKVEVCYKLSPKGSSAAKRFFDSVYSNANANRHNLELNNQYSSLTQYERDNWLTENQIRELVISKIEEISDSYERECYYNDLNNHTLSMPDGGYFSQDSQGNITFNCIEIVTNNYSKLDIEHKQNTIEFLGASCNFIKI